MCSNPNDIEIENAQNGFCNLLKKLCSASNNIEEKLTPDVLDLVRILQLFGFQITNMNVINPANCSKTKCGEKGVNISVICGKSGLRCNMAISDKCTCPEHLYDKTLWDNSDDSEKSSTMFEVKESHLPPISEGDKFVITNVLNHILHMLNNNQLNDQNANEVKTPSRNKSVPLLNKKNTSSSSKITKSISCNSVNLVTTMNPTIFVVSPDKSQDSPARYRSLDTLIGNSSEELIPEPGKLIKIKQEDENSIACLPTAVSNPDIHGDLRSSSPKRNPILETVSMKIGHEKLKKSVELIQEVMRDVFINLENYEETWDVSKIKLSVDSLLPDAPPMKQQLKSSSDTNIAKEKNEPTIKSLKPLCRPPIRSTSSIKTTTTVSKFVRSNSTRKPKENVANNEEKKEPTTTFKPNSKYAHIKSTLSKASLKK